MQSFDEIKETLGISKVDLLKMDIEGAEFSALLGMEKTLKKDKPLLMIEVHPEQLIQFGYSLQELIDFLGKFNYKFYPIDISKKDFFKTIYKTRNDVFHLFCK